MRLSISRHFHLVLLAGALAVLTMATLEHPCPGLDPWWSLACGGFWAIGTGLELARGGFSQWAGLTAILFCLLVGVNGGGALSSVDPFRSQVDLASWVGALAVLVGVRGLGEWRAALAWMVGWAGVLSLAACFGVSPFCDGITFSMLPMTALFLASA